MIELIMSEYVVGSGETEVAAPALTIIGINFEK